MSRRSRLTVVRVAAVLLLVVASIPVVAAYGSAPEAGAPGERGGGLASAAGATVATTDAVGRGTLVAFDARGNVVYQNRTYRGYHDVDPSPAGWASVTYVANEFGVPGEACGVEGSCIRNVVERVNLSTGAVTRLYANVSGMRGSSQVHDVDRVNESTLLVGDIGPPDRVYMVNTTTGDVVWEWRVSAAYEPESGGRYPGDWSHLNDVEYLDDGRVMVSLRNHDQVVFVEPGAGLQESWTLGSDGNHSRLFESHNPDYVPAERGGPAVLVADSENNRVVEYQRTGGEWRRSWRWRDSRLQWPRDADRLPNGHTLVADTHGNRLLEVTPGGEVTWRQPMPDGLYDAERLGTGDESAGGPSMQAVRERRPDADTTGTEPAERGAVERLTLALTSLVPPRVLHGLLFALPGWVDAAAALALAFQGLVAAVWGGVELGSAYRRRR